MKRELRPEQWHQLQIAKRTLRMNDVFVNVMGGMTKAEAKKVVKELEGK
jgi:hypothetical protein